MNVRKRIQELGWEFPQMSEAAGTYVQGLVHNGVLYISGKADRSMKGKLGREVSLELGTLAARAAVLQCLAAAESVLGDLDRIERALQVRGFVNCTSEFGEQPKVINGASDALVAIFGEAGRHVRTSIGVNALPQGIAVEIDVTFAVR